MIEPLLLSSHINFPRCINGVLNVRVYIYMFVNISHGIIHRLQAFQEKIFIFFLGGGGTVMVNGTRMKKIYTGKEYNKLGGRCCR